MSSEALISGRNKVRHMARITVPNVKIRDIVSRNVAESANSVINMLNGQGCNRKRRTSTKRGGGKAKKAAKQPARCKAKKKNIKRDIS